MGCRIVAAVLLSLCYGYAQSIKHRFPCQLIQTNLPDSGISPDCIELADARFDIDMLLSDRHPEQTSEVVLKERI